MNSSLTVERGKRRSIGRAHRRGSGVVAVMGVVYLSLGLVAGRPAAAQGVLKDLGTLGGASSSALALNQSGQVVGFSDTADGKSDAFIYDGSTMRDLTLGGRYSSPGGLNEAGQVTGYAGVADGSFHAFLGSAAGTVDLGTLAGGSFSQGIGVNNAGQVVGSSDVDGGWIHSFVWTPVTPNAVTGQLTDLGALGGTACFPTAINDRGQVAGSAATAGGLLHAFRWTSSGGMVDLTPNAPGPSSATAMNAAGMVVGQMVVDTAGSSHAFLYDGSLHDLGTLPGSSESSANAVSPAGLVAGASGNHAVLWPSPKQIADLGTLGGPTSEAWGVNDRGQVFGQSDVSSGDSHAFFYDGASMKDVTLGGSFSQLVDGQNGVTLDGLPEGLGNDGRAVGFGYVAGDAEAHPLLDSGGAVSDLGTLGGTWAEAADVNVRGQIVGYSVLADGLTEHAFIVEPPDSIPPATLAAVSGTLGSAGWYCSAVTVTLTANDDPGGSGVAATYYQIGGGAAQVYSAPFSVSADGNHTVEYWSVDQAGNQESPHPSVAVKIDRSPPITTASLAGAGGNHGWYRGAVTVTLSAQDSLSGVAATFYCVDGGATHTCSGPFTVSGDGTHSLRFWSKDNAGNCEAPESLTVKIDGTNPAVTASANPAVLWPAGGQIVAVTVSGKVTDTTSGVDPAAVSYAVVDSYGAIQPSGGVSVAADGSYAFSLQLQSLRNGNDKNGRTYTVSVKVADNAGNQGCATTTVAVPHNH